MLKSPSLRSLEDWKGSACCARLRRCDFLFDGKFFRQRKAQKQLTFAACLWHVVLPSLLQTQFEVRPEIYTPFVYLTVIHRFILHCRPRSWTRRRNFIKGIARRKYLSVHCWDCSLIQSNLVNTKVRNVSSALWTLLWLSVVHEDIYGKIFVL